MAQEGLQFADYYAAAPICSPSRAGLLTGCYPRRIGNETWAHRQRNLDASGRFAIGHSSQRINDRRVTEGRRLHNGLHWQMASRLPGTVSATQPRVRSLLWTPAQSRSGRDRLFRRRGRRSTDPKSRRRQTSGRSFRADKALHERSHSVYRTK